MSFSLKNKTIVVTGGSGLLGTTFVTAVRHAGGRCINADINCITDLDEDTVKLDITNEASLSSFLTELSNHRIQIDGWVNNAYPRTQDWGTRFEAIPLASWKENVDMHLNGYFLCLQRVLEVMKGQAGGSMVSIASIYGVVGPDFSVYDGTEMTMPAGYAAIKGGIINLTRYLASYYGPHGVRVNCLSPGGIFDNQPTSFVRNYEKKVPLRRMGRPDDIAPTLIYLLSDASAYVTGQNLMVDGGWGIV